MDRTITVLAGVMLTMIMLPVAATVVRGDEMVSRQDGKVLYQKNCAGCHGTLEDSAKGGRSMNRVRTAIRTLNQHREFSSLSDEQLLLIALVLKDVKD